jgi:hypothetical protein
MVNLIIRSVRPRSSWLPTRHIRSAAQLGRSCWCSMGVVDWIDHVIIYLCFWFAQCLQYQGRRTLTKTSGRIGLCISYSRRNVFRHKIGGSSGTCSFMGMGRRLAESSWASCWCCKCLVHCFPNDFGYSDDELRF